MKIPRDAVSDAEWRALEHGAVVHVRTGESRFAVTGKGALLCLQGLVTCDLAKAPDGSRLYGALLTSKGMIVAPLWIARTNAEHFTVETPATAAAALREVFAKSLPPRLCRWEDLSDATTGIGLYGPRAGAGIGPFPAALPAVVRGAHGLDGDLPADAAATLVTGLTAAGAVPASDALMASCRILAGIPSLGAEIDDKTLPQEVRGDELGAISYTKGCYLGQETVARVHFRGHPNRRLALLVLDGEPAAAPADASLDGKAVGRLGSAVWSDELDAWVGQAVIRREVEDGATLQTGGTTAVVRQGRWLREP
jgi:folate-binding protein YgfZ